MSENKVTDPTTGEQVEVIDVQLYALNLAKDGRVLSWMKLWKSEHANMQ